VAAEGELCGISLALLSGEERTMKPLRDRLYNDEQGAIGYIAAWLLGVPASVLFIIFLMRGCT
jgi:hypothetical protein